MNGSPTPIRFFPTVALVLSILPWLLSSLLLTASLGGTWAFLALALITFVVSCGLCGVCSLILATITLYHRIGIKRGTVAAILACVDLFFACLFLTKFLF